jgi:threonine/homoserine/homoserine lactone efflux protein
MMTWASRRRRFRQRMAEHDWLEGASVVIGVVFFLVAAACVWGLVVAVSSLGDAEPDISSQPSVLSGSTQGTIQATRWFGIALFAIFALVAAAVGWFLAGDAVRRTLRRSSS